MNADMIQIKIVRHSERLDYASFHKWIFYFGYHWRDSPLTAEGYKTAQEKGIALKTDGYNPTHIYTSPYSRTLATSTELRSSFLKSEIVVEPLIAEFQPMFIDRTSMYPNGIPTTYDGQDTGYSFPETFDNFVNRVHFIIFSLINKHDTDIMIVTHGAVLKVLISYLQTSFPDVLLNPGTTPYLTTLSFKYDKNSKTIVKDSVRLE